MNRVLSEATGRAAPGLLSEVSPLAGEISGPTIADLQIQIQDDSRLLLSDRPWTALQNAFDAHDADQNYAALLAYHSAERNAFVLKLCCKPYLLAVLNDEAAFSHAVRVSLLCGRKKNADCLCRMQLELTSPMVTEKHVAGLLRTHALRALADEKITPQEQQILSVYLDEGLSPQEQFAGAAYDRSVLRPEYRDGVLKNFAESSAQQYAQQLNEIGDAAARACADMTQLPEYLETVLDAVTFQIPTERFAELPKLFEDFGADAYALIVLLGVDVLDLSPTEREQLFAIHRTSSIGSASPFDVLTKEEALDARVSEIALRYPELFQAVMRVGGVEALNSASPARRVIDAVIRSAPGHAEEVLSRLSARACEKHSEVLVALCEGAGSYVPQLFRYVPENILQSSPQKVLSMSLRWGEDTWGFFRAFGSDAPQRAVEHAPFFEKIRDILRSADCDDEFGRVVGSLRSLSPRDVATYQLVAEACPRSMHSAFAALSQVVLDNLPPDVIVKIARASEYGAEAAFLALDPVIRIFRSQNDDAAAMQAWAATVGQAASNYGLKFPNFLQACSSALLINDIEALSQLPAAYGASAAAMCKQFREEVLDFSPSHRAALTVLEPRLRARTPNFIADVPHARWFDQGSYLIDTFGTWAGTWYKKCPPNFWEVPHPSLEALVKRSREEFRITASQRWVKWQGSTLDTSLLEMNLENLDPEVRKELPLMVVIVSEDDYNGALEREYELLKRMSYSHKLFIFEARNPEEVFSALDRVAYLHGSDADGRPLKTIDVFNLSAHGAYDSLLLGPTYRGGPDSRFRVTHALQLTRRASYFTPGGDGVLAACWVASDAEGSGNLLSAMHQSIPQFNWWGAKRSVNVASYQHDMLGRFHSPEFDCGASKVVRLAAKL